MRNEVALLSTLAAATLPGAAAAPAEPARFDCSDRTVVTVRFPDTRSMLLTLGGRTLTLLLAPSADGTRYIGEGWQWWGKGMSQATLAPLARGETIATAPGAACRARP